MTTATITLVGGEINVLEHQLRRAINEYEAGPRPDMAAPYRSILTKIKNAQADQCGVAFTDPWGGEHRCAQDPGHEDPYHRNAGDGVSWLDEAADR
ncbi:hypothetical protein ABZ249_29935 [Nocardiopsis sp. NPDC006139]|uniref:hypothetical protein n=1 Tax=Nocardiopsis sp. NPDC006139 TaxID=3154578 RepID=UPI0033B3510A